MKAELVSEILDYLSPFLVHAGRYALAIQEKVASQPPKGANRDPFYDALTDADLSVQAFIEVALLARFPGLGFYGEEFKHSLNMKYFSPTAELCLYLDPIDGTRYFRDNLAAFNVIATIADHDEVNGVCCYLPRYDRYFRAEKNKGTKLQTAAQVLDQVPGKSFDLKDNHFAIVTYDFPEVVRRLSGKFNVVDVAAAYTPEKGCLSLNSILLGESSVVIGRGCGLIDWGAIAFLAQESGGVVSDFSGNPPPPPSQLKELRYPELLICKDKTTQAEVLALLKNGMPPRD